MIKQLSKRVSNDIDINQFFYNLTAQIKEPIYVKKNIEYLITTKQYNEQVNHFIVHHNNLNAMGLQSGLSVMSHIMDYMGFDNQENKLRMVLIDQADKLLDQPINVVCETFYNISLLRGDTTKFAEKIIQYLKEEQAFPEVSYMKTLRAIGKKAKLNDLDLELIEKLDNIDIQTYSIPASIKIFRLYAEFHPQYQKPFYSFPKTMKVITENVNDFPSQSIYDILCAYYHADYDEGYLKKVIIKFEKQLQDSQGLFNQEKYSLCSQILRIASKLDQSLFNWDLYLNEFLYQLYQNKFVNKSMIDSFCSIFATKMTRASIGQLNQTWSILKQHMKQQSVWDFMNINKTVFPKETIAEFIQQFENITLPSYSDYNQFAICFNLPQNQPESFKKQSLAILNYSYSNHDEFGLRYLEQLNFSSSVHWGCQLKILLTSINNERTSQFWKKQTMNLEEVVKSEYSYELQRQINQDYYQFQKIFNYHQIEFVLWSLNEFELPPIKVAPTFYKKAAQYQDLINKISCLIVTRNSNFTEAGLIWEQLGYCNNKQLISYLRIKSDTDGLQRIKQKLLEFD